jgi:hypothetical protein
MRLVYHPSVQKDVNGILTYHILFRHLPFAVRIIVVRHNKRHPNVGTSRR